VHRCLTYPVLSPFILAYELTKDQKMLDKFYSIRSIPHGIPKRNGLRLAKYGGKLLLFPSSEDPFFDDVFLRNVYYRYEPRKDHILFDVGAHMGFFTVKMASRVKKVIAFEPDPYNFEFLCANIQYNGSYNVIAFNYALGSENSSLFLNRNYGYGRTRLTKTNTGLKVEVKKLDSIVKQLGVCPNVIKIDVEGSEMKVLEGAKVTLARCRPRLIIASYHYASESEEIIRYLANAAFRCFLYTVPLTLQRKQERYVYAESVS
jgi:FkbM family methyltransferase